MNTLKGGQNHHQQRLDLISPYVEDPAQFYSNTNNDYLSAFHQAQQLQSSATVKATSTTLSSASTSSSSLSKSSDASLGSLSDSTRSASSPCYVSSQLYSYVRNMYNNSNSNSGGSGGGNGSQPSPSAPNTFSISSLINSTTKLNNSVPRKVANDEISPQQLQFSPSSLIMPLQPQPHHHHHH